MATRREEQKKAAEAFLAETEAKIETRGRKRFLNPNERKNAQTTILLRPTTKENLKELAWRRRTSLNELINQICEEYLKDNFEE